MPHSADDEMPVASLVNGEMLYPTAMHGTRDSVVVSGTRETPDSAICDGDRNMLSKLAERGINYLRKFAG